MAIEFSNIEITEYEAVAQHVFQQKKSHLQDIVLRRPVTGRTVVFDLLGSVEANDNPARHSEKLGLNQDHDPITATVVDTDVTLWIDDLDQFKTNKDYRSMYSETAMAALMRRIDKRVLTAMDASHTDTSVSGNALTAATLIGLGKELTNAEVPLDGNRFIVCPASGLEDILNDDKMVNRDYIQSEAFANGFVKGVLGFTIIVIEKASLFTSETAGKKTCFAFHGDAVGLATNKEPGFRLDYRPDRNLWQTLATMANASAVIQPLAVRSIEIDD